MADISTEDECLRRLVGATVWNLGILSLPDLPESHVKLSTLYLASHTLSRSHLHLDNPSRSEHWNITIIYMSGEINRFDRFAD